MKSVEIRSFTPNAGKYGPEITPYLDTFHIVRAKTREQLILILLSLYISDIICMYSVTFDLEFFEVLNNAVFVLKFGRSFYISGVRENYFLIIVIIISAKFNCLLLEDFLMGPHYFVVHGKPQTSDLRMTYEYIRVACGWHMST